MAVSTVPIIFLSARADSALERFVVDARRKAALSTISRLSGVAGVEAPTIVSDDPELLELAQAHGADVVLSDERFHFGRTLASLADKREAEQVLYVGGGSAALMSECDWDDFLALLDNQPGVVPNNLFSADFALVRPASALNNIELPAIDNDLAFRLAKSGLPARLPQRSLANQFDIDTVIDVVIAAYHPNCPAGIRSLVQLGGFTPAGIEQIRSIAIDPDRELLVSGRVGAGLWQVLETETACRKRVFSEERGMRASGREEAGLVRSVLGTLLETQGPAGFVEVMSKMADGAVIDSRVLMAHMRWQPTQADRFASDLLLAEQIAHPALKRLIEELRKSGWPVLLGGHNLVSAGLWTLAENAWSERDAARAALSSEV